MSIIFYLFPGFMLGVFNSNVTTKFVQIYWRNKRYCVPLVQKLEGFCPPRLPLKLGPWLHERSAIFVTVAITWSIFFVVYEG